MRREVKNSSADLTDTTLTGPHPSSNGTEMHKAEQTWQEPKQRKWKPKLWFQGAYAPRVARIWRLPEPRGRPLRRPELKPAACSPCPGICMPLPLSPPPASLGFSCSAPKLHACGVAAAYPPPPPPPWPGSARGGDGVRDVDGGEGEERYSTFAAPCGSASAMETSLNRPRPASWPPATAMPTLPSM
jgi:hypothetical protein